MTPLSLSITGMSCGHCLNAVNQALSKIPGVKLGSVRMGRAELEYDPASVTPDAITSAVTSAGYQAAVIK